MSDPAPDPIDKAYAEAEAAMNDEAARATRRARVMAAVAAEPAAALPPASRRRPAWRGGGWLVAASIAGLSAFVVLQNYQPAPHLPETKPAAPAAPIPAPQGIVAPPAPVVRTPPPPSLPKVVTIPPMEIPPAATPPPPALKTEPPAPSAPPAPPPPPPPPSDAASERAAPAPAAIQPEAAAGGVDDRTTVTDVVVTAQRREERLQKVPVAVSAFTGAKRDLVGIQSVQSVGDPGVALRGAAAAGRTKEMEALLKQGDPIDAPDADGDTALIESIEADQPAAAALLVRHGASLDHKNHAGQSARDLATAKGDARLNKALGLKP